MDINAIIEEVTRQVSGELLKPEKKPQGLPVEMTEVVSHLEHSLLNPDMSREKIAEECRLARKYGFASVCVSPYYTSLASEILLGSGVSVCTAVGFPQGAVSTAAKLCEIREATKNGATEIDAALNILAIKSGEIAEARQDLLQMVETAAGRAKLKAVYEQGLYTPEEKDIVLNIIKTCGCNFVKIQNVASGKPASEEDVLFVRDRVGRNVGIKIDGGVKTLQQAMALLGASADRIGLTASVKIAQEVLEKTNKRI